MSQNLSKSTTPHREMLFIDGKIRKTACVKHGVNATHITMTHDIDKIDVYCYTSSILDRLGGGWAPTQYVTQALW